MSNNKNQEHLLKYLEDGNLTDFTKLLESKDNNNIDPNHEYSGPYYKTCLAIASQKGMVEFIKVLLANNADPNLKCEQHNGYAPIHFAAEKGHFDAIKCLVQHPATKVDIIKKNMETALHLSARSLTNNEECFSYLANLQGMSVSQRNTRGQTAISEAVGKCTRDTLRNILQRPDLRPEDMKLILDERPELNL
jgi:ankyrin repeat protein